MQVPFKRYDSFILSTAYEKKSVTTWWVPDERFKKKIDFSEISLNLGVSNRLSFLHSKIIEKLLHKKNVLNDFQKIGELFLTSVGVAEVFVNGRFNYCIFDLFIYVFYLRIDVFFIMKIIMKIIDYFDVFS